MDADGLAGLDTEPQLDQHQLSGVLHLLTECRRLVELVLWLNELLADAPTLITKQRAADKEIRAAASDSEALGGGGGLVTYLSWCHMPAAGERTTTTQMSGAPLRTGVFLQARSLLFNLSFSVSPSGWRATLCSTAPLTEPSSLLVSSDCALRRRCVMLSWRLAAFPSRVIALF